MRCWTIQARECDRLLVIRCAVFEFERGCLTMTAVPETVMQHVLEWMGIRKWDPSAYQVRMVDRANLKLTSCIDSCIAISVLSGRMDLHRCDA